MDTQLRFSEHLGVSRQVLEKWLNKGSVPELAQVVKIAAHYPEVYKVMDIDPPLSRDQLPPNFATLVDNAKAEAEAELSRLGLASGSKEGLKIATAIFEKYGFIFKQTTKG